MKGMLKSNKGFTLIEVLVAMGIIMLIAMAFFSVNNTSIITNAKNEKDIQAMNIAQSVMEDIREYIKEDKEYIESKYQIDIYNNEKWTNDKYNESIKSTQKLGNNMYNINIEIYRENISNRYLYKIIVDVSTPNNNKNTKLITQIFEI